MELKPYQKQTINDLRTYLSHYTASGSPEQAFKDFWGNHPRTPLNPLEIEKYTENISGVPHVCLKVPTAGGKTFIACNAIKPLFDNMPLGKPQVVLWMVPSSTILDQTIKNLQNPHHPYRQKIDTHFGGRVEVCTKEQVLMGTNFSPTTVKEQLTIIVGSFSSFKKTRNKENRKVYQENSNLAEFTKTYNDHAKLVEETDETALIQVINQHNPVVIVDESHNAESDLSIDMLKNLNPSFILDLTATPRKNSNIISYTDAWELKKENMVKLPVIVYNHHDTGDVINSSIQLRHSLEDKAIEEEKNGGKYIRPIILFQAQTKNEKDAETFERIKKKLIKAGIKEEEIAIKTAEINEIKGHDLQSKDCPIRYIITINALKEGWDCPSAYILATLANRSSSVDVEQILGRILRQPHVKQHKEPLLNLSYVFTASAMFGKTLDNIVKGLNKSGFSKKDYRVISPETEDDKTSVINEQLGLISPKPVSNDNDEIDFDETKIEIGRTSSLKNETIKNIETQALEENANFEEEIKSRTSDDMPPTDLWDKVKSYPMKQNFKEIAEAIELPQFFIEKPASLIDDSVEILLEKNDLVKDFQIKHQNTKINFDAVSSEMYKVDISENEDSPQYKMAGREVKNYILQYIEGLSEKQQLKQLAGLIFKEIRKINGINDRDLMNYIQRVIEDFNSDQVADLKQNPFNYGSKIRNHITNLLKSHAEKTFYQWLDTDKIKLSSSFKWKKKISPAKTQSAIPKSLYEEEGEINNFEWEVINQLANFDNTDFWHRNEERREFCINGGFTNHYPDFFIRTKKDNLILLETKGEHLANEDSERKIKLGNIWANKAGTNYKYFMVFKDKAISGAYTLSDFLKAYKEL